MAAEGGSSMPFEALVASSPDLIAFFGLDGTVDYLNDAGRALVGLPDDVDVTTTVISDYVLPGRQAQVMSRQAELLEHGMIATKNVLRHWQGGDPIPVDQSTFLVRADTGAPVAFGTVQRDRRKWSRAEEALRHMSDVLLVCDADGLLLYASPSAGRTLGYEDGDYLGRDLREFVHPDDRHRALRELSRVLSVPASPARTSLRLLVADGAVRDFEAVANNLLDEPSIGGIIVVARDVTDRLRSERAERTHSRVLELIATGSDLDKVLGTVAEWIGEQLAEGTRCTVLLEEEGRLRDAASPGFPQAFHDAIDGSSVEHGPSPCAQATRTGLPVIVPDLMADEQWLPVRELAAACDVRSCWSFPVLSQDTGRTLGAFALYRSEPGLPDAGVEDLMSRGSHLVGLAVERRALLSRLAHQALHDELTGLPNRLHLLEVLEVALSREPGAAPAPVVLFLDLDRLMVVNDSLGHELGDELLISTAQRLREALDGLHFVARFGGDEFVVVAEGLAHEDEVIAFARRVLAAVAVPVLLAEREINPAASAGIVRALPGQSPTDVLRDADIAMYRAKSVGGGRFTLFGPDMRQRAFDRLDLEGQIRTGIEAGDFRLHFQPVVDLAESCVVGFEALVRWDHPIRGLLLPESFIDVAEETGLIVPLGEWVLEASAEAVRSWRAEADVPALWLSVNLSSAQLGSPSLGRAVRASSQVMAPWTLGLELTESTLLVDTERTRALLAELAELGVELSIDDFGTGYSSLSYLTRLPFRTLKIDRSFVAALGRSPQAATVAEAVVRLGDGLRLRVIAEGVETEEQRDILRAMGCRYAQGYLFGRPTEPAEALALMLP
jgi:diguanylate cyclase (GGDEF)-like protein/PAS domain S-box-containing protein